MGYHRGSPSHGIVTKRSKGVSRSPSKPTFALSTPGRSLVVDTLRNFDGDFGLLEQEHCVRDRYNVYHPSSLASYVLYNKGHVLLLDPSHLERHVRPRCADHLTAYSCDPGHRVPSWQAVIAVATTSLYTGQHMWTAACVGHRDQIARKGLTLK
jgi:hypothetical protein